MKATAHFSLILILLDELIVRTSGVKWLYISTQGLSHNHLNIAQGEELNTSYTGGGKGKAPSKSHSTPWGAHNSNLIDDERECDKIKGMVKKQRRICKKNLELMRGVQSGGWEAIAECQYQFRGRRWNCTTLKSASVFGKIINRGTRETAFLHAISSAGVAHSVTRYCSSGTVDQCGCDKTVSGLAPQGNFQWAGCSDNVAYGNAFTKTFVDSRERVRGESATRALMNLHNNNAGRKILEDSVQVLCKCHGVSGSCEMRTCWRALPPFRHIGDVLREKFDSATEVLERRVGSRRELVGKDPRVKPHEDSDLVYVENSPDFCERNLKVGSVGTRGRHCKRDSEGMDGCELMCCGRGFQTLRVQVTERCRCSFHWCCTVKCQMCRKEVEIYVCR